MARYTGPRDKISRRFGVPVFGPSKYLERKNYPPGTHGPRARRKHSDYALALMEKQKLRFHLHGCPRAKSCKKHRVFQIS